MRIQINACNMSFFEKSTISDVFEFLYIVIVVEYDASCRKP